MTAAARSTIDLAQRELSEEIGRGFARRVVTQLTMGHPQAARTFALIGLEQACRAEGITLWGSDDITLGGGR